MAPLIEKPGVSFLDNGNPDNTSSSLEKEDVDSNQSNQIDEVNDRNISAIKSGTRLMNKEQMVPFSETIVASATPPKPAVTNVIQQTPILVEIIGATNLKHPPNTSRSFIPSNQKKPIHPFVETKLHGRGASQIVAKTKRIQNTCDPIWCVEDRCFFLLKVTEEMLSESTIVSADESENREPSTSDTSKRNNPSNLTCLIEFNVRHKVPNDPLFSSTHLCSSTMEIQELWDHCTNFPEERIELQLELQPSKLISREQTASSKINHDIGSINTSPTKSILRNVVRMDTYENEAIQKDMSGCKLALRARFASDLDVKLMNELAVMQKRGKYKPFHCDTQAFINGFVNDEDNDDDEKEEQSSPRKNINSNRKNKKVEFITEMSQKSVGVSGLMNIFNSPLRNTKKDREGNIQYKVKPYPDPNRKKATTYLTHAELDDEMMNPSTNWIAAGKETSQSLGQVYLEVLKCSGLPNMDTGEALGNKTDAFVCAIFEESMVQTDVIDDKLSPFWMPWSQRAFVFQITHPSSPLFVSVNDFDMGPSGHDGIGRIAINLSHFKSDTVYTLEYRLYPASNVTRTNKKTDEDEDDFGTITIRLRKEIKDEKNFLLQSLKPTPRFHVNMKRRMSLPVANFTCLGAHSEEQFDLILMRSYVNEMLEMKRFLVYAINDAITSLIEWKGQVKVGNHLLPLHSAVAFFGGSYIIERPHLIPGCFFLGIAWIMLAGLNSRIHHPSPWQRTLPFYHYLSLLILGKSQVPHDDIRPFQFHRESCRFEEKWKSRIENDLNAVNAQWELQLEIEKIGNEDIQTEEKKNVADPMEIAKSQMSPWLFPMQRRLKRYCGYMRNIKKLTTWEDGMLSFWITFPCIVIGIVLLILPTVFLIHWSCRLFIWIFLGPWRRTYYEIKKFIAKRNNPSYFINDDIDVMKNIKERFQEIEHVARMKGEDAMKMKSMRTIRFGEYIAKVPPTNTTRYYDFPLSESKASHISKNPVHDMNSPDVTVKFIPSQRLEGNMIPMTEEQMALIGKKSRNDLTNQEIGNNLIDMNYSEDDVASLESPRKDLKADAMKDSLTDNSKKDWLDTTLDHLSSITFQNRTKVILSSNQVDVDEDNEIKEKLNIDDKVLHITADDLLMKEKEDKCNLDDTSELSNLTDHDFEEDLKEEEGLEIVAWEQTAISIKINGEDVDMNEDSSQGTESSLSAVYKSSDSVYMAFCRSPRSKSEDQ